MDRNTLTYERLHEILHYGPITGTFTWKETRGANAVAGKIAGSKKRNGYIQMIIDGKHYLAHRVAWFYVNGYFPEHGIDHINKIKDDNSISNLREVSQQCNSRNCNLSKNNSSNVNGVTWHKVCNQWVAQLKVGYKNKHLGCYDDFDDAVCARLAAEQCLGWSGCDSTSSAYLYVQKMLGRSSE